MIGTDISITHIGFLKKVPAIVLNEDDININRLFCNFSYPFASQIITPCNCSVGRYSNKQIKYKGYQKLAYLHPNWFIPDINIVKKYFPVEVPYFIIRLVSFAAGHDIEKRHKGIDNKTLKS